MMTITKVWGYKWLNDSNNNNNNNNTDVFGYDNDNDDDDNWDLTNINMLI
jgi:hypothetical protein